MLVGLIADVHSRADRLAQSLRLLADCACILCAGDISDQSRFDAEALRMILEGGVLAIQGNHDRAACANPLVRRAAEQAGTVDWLRRLGDLPSHRCLTLDGLRVGLFHGSPWDRPESDFFQYVFAEVERDVRRAADAGFDVVVLGHTHSPMDRAVGGGRVINPGSCGCGSPPTCAALDTVRRVVEFRALPPD